ncbi:Cof-type HAD-IIB family hydrolase [Anaerocolumna xylanovorans]|uniref:Haloacid dehalogenase-like hydrolase n=1 Tax=Anaerocolumna xylanovorans DSM 12503 TaxID=1121345 RepID=A0A1M7YDG1_9FIRM|nr:Cof-type HAD-IIB family hydrolase [Anaerocolumna xylanovorans]SHO50643.1 hypothetical protein SAMN02745217_02831 [Anaerocolumna xylanovorans DSM 12503]
MTRADTRKIKLIGLDLDGTLLNGKKQITDRSKEAMKKAIEKGVFIVPATGRPLNGVPREVLEFPGIKYVLTVNGARITDIKQNKILYEVLTPMETVWKIKEIFDRYDTMQEVYFDGVGYAREDLLRKITEYESRPGMAEYITATRVRVKSIEEKLREMNRPVDKVQAFFKREEEKQKAWEELKMIPHLEVTTAGKRNIEVSREGVNKGAGLLKLGEMLGIKRDEIMACGDEINDLVMLREIGFAVAMGNSPDIVKAAADYITETNEEDGVAKAIERFVLK